MENWLVTLLVIVGLVVGVFAGGALFSTEKEVEVEVPGVCEECPECEVCEVCEETIVEVPAPSLLDKAVEDFMKAVEDEDVEDQNGSNVNLLETIEHEYDFEEISIRKVYDDYTIEYDGDETIVTFDIKLKYKEDGESSEKVKYNVEVILEEGEDTIVKATIVED